MRRFSSYGPVHKELNYYVSREELIQNACVQIIGEKPEKGGHYITVWAPRQCGKTWTMHEVLWRLQKDKRFDVVKADIEHLKMTEDLEEIVQTVAEEIAWGLDKTPSKVKTFKDFENIFKKDMLDKPLILIIDEFDALCEEAISGIAGAFRNIYNKRSRQTNKTTGEKDYLLHSVALIGVRNVLGIENERGSPFNMQRSVHIPNLTYEETDSMFKWYEKETGHKVEQEVTDRLYYETMGQPGLVSWFGELLTEGFEYFRPDYTRPLALKDFDEVYAAAIQVMPNNNILNIISKAKQEPHKYLVLEMFKTREKIPFRFDDVRFNFLYTNGVIDLEKSGGFFTKFSCPFVQKRLFNYFSHELFSYMGSIFEPFEDTKDTIT
ncbi:MAG: AAA family ATPase, partial [Desulfobacterales bacterium]|nr:AAA family ATPase [Desulfobacterales bacterium]